MRVLISLMLAVVLGVVGWVVLAMNWSYSSGERAGWVQKFSNKGWLCKTWEGELAMVFMPGAVPEKFFFTVWDDSVAQQVNAAMGRRVTLHYEEKVGLPSSCFGDTRSWVTRVTVVEDVPGAPGLQTQPLPAPTLIPTPPTPAPTLAPTPSPIPSPTSSAIPSSPTPAATSH